MYRNLRLLRSSTHAAALLLATALPVATTSTLALAQAGDAEPLHAEADVAAPADLPMDEAVPAAGDDVPSGPQAAPATAAPSAAGATPAATGKGPPAISASRAAASATADDAAAEGSASKEAAAGEAASGNATPSDAAATAASGLADAPGPDHASPAPTSSADASPAAGGGAVAGTGADGKFDFIADGQRVAVKDGDLSLLPPQGWQVFTQLQGLTLLMQVPYQPGMKYQRTIQVASFTGPRFIDAVTATEFEKEIVRKFSAVTSSVEDYKIRNHMDIEMADGRSGLLFYSEFKLDGVDLMQAHILVSSAERHYLMTFTDLAAHFENEAASQYLTEAWDSMISVELATATPGRYALFIRLGIGAGVIVLLLVGFVAFRRWGAGREYQDFADSGEADAGVSSHAVSAVGSLVASKMTSDVISQAHSKLDSNIVSLAASHLSEPLPRASNKPKVVRGVKNGKPPQSEPARSQPAASTAMSMIEDFPDDDDDDLAI